MKFAPLYAALLALLLPLATRAQGVGIGTTTPDASAVLEVKSNAKGLLLPRLTAAQREAIVNPAAGLMVYQTDGTPGLYYYNGTAWTNSTNGRIPDANGFTVVPNAGGVNTLAGIAGNSGSADGSGANARFNGPKALAAASTSVLYVADMGNSTIRKITSSGQVTTFSGAAMTPGSDDGSGPGVTGQLGSVGLIAVDGAGTLYVADAQNSTIRKVSATGYISTLAGTAGASGSTDGTGAAARFSSPTGVAVDAAGVVYVADTYNYTIRRITPAGVVTTLAGTAGASGSADGTGAAARFYVPWGIAVDGAGVVYVSDQNNYTIRRITPAGVVTTLAGTAGASGSADGTGAAARFFSPTGLAVDGAGVVYVADTDNSTIRRITPAGVVTTLAGTAGSFNFADGTGAAARFTYPTGVAVDAAGTVYVADKSNQVIRQITSAGVVTTLAGSVRNSGSSDSPFVKFSDPEGVAVNAAGVVYVGDSRNYKIRRISNNNVSSLTNGSRGSADDAGARFNQPAGIAVDGAGVIYVGDTQNHTIRKITPAGVVTTLAGTAGVSGSADGTGVAARFNQPRGVAVDAAGVVYVADQSSHTIRRITPAGVVTTLAGTAGASGSADGTGAAARFSSPTGVAVDAAGVVYVADTYNHVIRKITPAGVVTTLAVGFSSPSGVAIAATGPLYVSDSSNNAIKQVTPAGVVTTLAGGTQGSNYGFGTSAQFQLPDGVAVDAAGTVYVADSNTHIRIIK